MLHYYPYRLLQQSVLSLHYQSKAFCPLWCNNCKFYVPLSAPLERFIWFCLVIWRLLWGSMTVWHKYHPTISFNTTRHQQTLLTWKAGHRWLTNLRQVDSLHQFVFASRVHHLLLRFAAWRRVKKTPKLKRNNTFSCLQHITIIIHIRTAQKI